MAARSRRDGFCRGATRARWCGGELARASGFSRVAPPSLCAPHPASLKLPATQNEGPRNASPRLLRSTSRNLSPPKTGSFPFHEVLECRRSSLRSIAPRSPIRRGIFSRLLLRAKGTALQFPLPADLPVNASASSAFARPELCPLYMLPPQWYTSALRKEDGSFINGRCTESGDCHRRSS